jgi:hypothetical protein
LFGSLGASAVFVNPANVTLATDNRINMGGVASDLGTGSFISLMAPNFSISSAWQKIDVNDTSSLKHKKQLLHFNFGISTMDLGYGNGQRDLAIGLAVKRQADRLLGDNDEQIYGGSAVSLDVGFLINWQSIALEFALVDLNNPKLNDSEMRYGRGFLVGGRFRTQTGLTIALQGIGGNTYGGSDYGLNLGAEQSFFARRLVARLQLTSFFAGPKATMQNISSCIGYRLAPGYRLPALLQDLELCYALSFLSTPNNVGTHVLVLSKYF